VVEASICEASVWTYVSVGINAIIGAPLARMPALVSLNAFPGRFYTSQLARGFPAAYWISIAVWLEAKTRTRLNSTAAHVSPIIFK